MRDEDEGTFHDKWKHMNNEPESVCVCLQVDQEQLGRLDDESIKVETSGAHLAGE